MSRLLSLLEKAFVLALVAVTGALNSTGLASKKYNPLHLGEIQPSGWLADQLQVQVNGLAGRQHTFYNYIAQSDWTGGTALYSNLEEAGSYWFNGIVPTSIVGNSDELRSRASYFMNYVLEHQDSTGWIGPEVFDQSKPRFLWGRYPFLLGVTQFLEANNQNTTEVIDSVYKFVELANQLLTNGEGRDPDGWGDARWFEFAISLQWLYEFHPNDKEEVLLDTMEKLKTAGFDWERVFSEELFPKTSAWGMPNPFNTRLVWHGVNVAEALKAGAVAYRFTHNETELSATSAAWDRLFRYHGRPSGVFAADEHLAGLEAARGSELCLVVVEKIAYNALPATLTGDMWSRQYLQQQNQIAAKNMDPNPFPSDGSYANVFGLEPNYPCCTVNHPQGWPKFVSNAFLKTSDNQGLVHLYLGPFKTTTVLGQDNSVTVEVDTLYPFSDTLTTKVTATKPFKYYVRIPSWVTGGTISSAEGSNNPLSPSNGLQEVDIPAGISSFTLTLPAEIAIESRPHNSVAVHRGPFTYAFDIQRKQTVLKTDPNEPHAMDLQFDATEDWEYAIDPASLQFHSTSLSKLPSPIFDSGLPPLSITARACKVNWTLAGDTYASSPPENPDCVGEEREITLWPFGATKLRIGEFPVMKGSNFTST
ncbi:hypothetical protein VNI00_000510 [Paramarasmius palmivorus]|uniref:Uncharacterized protein n=1 Tax=Paramarasmius palmivorus TaxID=297713 RepID=A0AAW0EBG7_9AGAR